MSYYVSVQTLNRERSCLVLGPFRVHGDALRNVGKFKRWAEKNTKEGWRGMVAYGTCRHLTAHEAGKFNQYFDLVTDNSGFILEVGEAKPNGSNDC